MKRTNVRLRKKLVIFIDWRKKRFNTKGSVPFSHSS